MCQALSWVLCVDSNPWSPHCKTCEVGTLVASDGGGAPGLPGIVRPAAPSPGGGLSG